MKQTRMRSLGLCGNKVKIARQFDNEVGHSSAVMMKLPGEYMFKCVTCSMIMFLTEQNEITSAI